MLSRKLHIKPGMRFAIVDAPDGFARALGKPPAGATQEKALTRELDLVVLFTTTQKHLRGQWRKALAALKPDGALWVSYPKKTSGIETDLGMGEWEASQGSDWAQVAMIAVDDKWSAVRFRHRPGLEQARHAREEEALRDADGTVCVDRAKRIVTPPGDLQRLFDRNARARAAFEALAFTHKREYVTWILEAKKAETRTARLGKTVDMLARGRKNPSDK